VFLRQLTLKGFKSFAETTVLTLEPGVTVVVGPNGSGKSNVVDAIAWVLGAQAPSAVRSATLSSSVCAFANTSTVLVSPSGSSNAIKSYLRPSLYSRILY
jgi:chromosome segregation protein